MNTLITSLKLPPPPPAAVDGRKHSPYLWKFISFVQVKTSILKLHRQLTRTEDCGVNDFFERESLTERSTGMLP